MLSSSDGRIFVPPNLLALAMVAVGGSGIGNAAPMDSPGEGHGAANNLINKSRKPRGRCNSPATSSKVSDVSSFFLATA